VEIGRGGVDWIGLALIRDAWIAVVSAVIEYLVLQNAGKLSIGCATDGLPNSAEIQS
jgi:hypothetical protein